MLTYSINSKWYEKFAAFYLAFASILQTYGYGGFLNFSRLCSFVLIFVVLCVCMRKATFSKVPTSLSAYFYWLFLVSILSCTSLADAIPLGQIEKFLLVTAIFSFVNYNKFLPIYKLVSYVSIAYLYIQLIVFHLSGVHITGIIGFLPLDLAYVFDVEDFYDLHTRENARVSSFFSEPALFVQYVIPLFTIELFNASKFKDWIKVIIVFISILATESGNGLFLLLLVGVSYLVYVLRYKSVIWRILLPIALIGLFIGGQEYLKTDSAERLLERQDELSNDIEYTSGFLRIFRGYYVYEEFTPIEKVIGVNNLTILDERIKTCKAAFTFKENDYYANTFQKFLLNTGIIGVIFFIIIMFGLMRNNTPVGRTIAFVYFGSSFIAASYLAPIMFLYLYIAYMEKKSLNGM